MIIDALRDKYSLSQLIGKLGISKSNYCYQHNVQQLPCRYEDKKTKVIEFLKRISKDTDTEGSMPCSEKRTSLYQKRLYGKS